MLDLARFEMPVDVACNEDAWWDRPEWLAVPAASGRLHQPAVFGPCETRWLTCFADGGAPDSRKDLFDAIDGADVLGPKYESGWDGCSRLDLEILDPCGVGCGGSRLGGDASISLTKHALDLALSRGRHAVERAKLAGSHCFVGVAWNWETGLLRQAVSPVGDPYRQLARLGDVELAALVGAAVSAGQMGLPMICIGHGGATVLSLVRRLHSGVSAWLVPARALAGTGRTKTRGPIAGSASDPGFQSVIEDLQATAAGACSR